MQSETLAQEFSRLVKEYHEGDDHTKPEAWNLLADYAVDNADAISAALSDKQAGEVKIKPLEWEEIVGGDGVWWAAKNPLGGLPYEATSYTERTRKDAEHARLVRSALVDVPAVEPVKKSSEEMLRLAVAAVLEADTEFRAHLPKGWEGDPLSDEIDGLRRIFETSPPLSREGEDSAEVIEKIARAMCERDGADWDAIDCNHTANGNEPEEQRDYWRDKADAALAAKRSGSATTASGTSAIRQRGESDA